MSGSPGKPTNGDFGNAQARVPKIASDLNAAFSLADESIPLMAAQGTRGIFTESGRHGSASAETSSPPQRAQAFIRPLGILNVGNAWLLRRSTLTSRCNWSQRQEILTLPRLPIPHRKDRRKWWSGCFQLPRERSRMGSMNFDRHAKLYRFCARPIQTCRGKFGPEAAAFSI